MPINANVEYQIAEKNYNEATTLEEKIRGLEKMIATAPSHKGAENLRANLILRLSKFRKQVELEKKQKGSRHQIAVKKEGAATLAIIGVTNSGKSTLLQKLTKAKPTISEFPFTTRVPEIGIMDHEGIKVQLVEIPAIFENFIKSEKGPLFLGLIRQVELVVIILRDDPEKELSMILKELYKSNIYTNKRKPDNENDYSTYLRAMIINNSGKRFDKSGIDVVDFNDPEINKKIWDNIGIIYVFTKSPGKKKDFPPVSLKKDSTVKDLATVIHKDFIKKFNYAKVWGNSAKFKNGQVVGLNHILNEQDIIEFHLK